MNEWNHQEGLRSPSFLNVPDDKEAAEDTGRGVAAKEAHRCVADDIARDGRVGAAVVADESSQRAVEHFVRQASFEEMRTMRAGTEFRCLDYEMHQQHIDEVAVGVESDVTPALFHAIMKLDRFFMI